MRLILSSTGGALCGLLFLAACSQTGATQMEALTEPASAPCAAAEWQMLVGQIAGEVDMASLPQPSMMIETGATPADIDRSRMMLAVGEDGRVSHVDCR